MCQPSISDLLFDDNRLLLCTKCNLPFLSLNKKWRRECSNPTEPQLFQCMLTHSASDVENNCSDGTESHNRSVSDLPVYSLQCRVQILLHVEQRGSSGWFLYGVRQSHDPAIISEPLLSLNKKFNTKIYNFISRELRQWHYWAVAWHYLLHFQNAVLQDVLIGQGHTQPLTYIKTLIL